MHAGFLLKHTEQRELLGLELFNLVKDIHVLRWLSYVETESKDKTDLDKTLHAEGDRWN